MPLTATIHFLGLCVFTTQSLVPITRVAPLTPPAASDACGRQWVAGADRWSIWASCSRSFQATSASPLTNERKFQTVMT